MSKRITLLSVVIVVVATMGSIMTSGVQAAVRRSPQIVGITSTPRGSYFDLKIKVVHGLLGSQTTTKTTVSIAGSQCVVPPSKSTCRLLRIKSLRRISLATTTYFGGGGKVAGKTVRYLVTDSDWVAQKSAEDVPLALPASVRKRPFDIRLPERASPTEKIPLVLLLHGYGSSGARQEAYMKFSAIADQKKFALISPDGTTNRNADKFWNAGSICCDFYNSQVDDEQYLMDLISYSVKKYSLDKNRIYVVGHSNGGAMAYRLACKRPNTFAAVASLAGIGQFELTSCNGSSPLGSLHIHGTNDESVAFGGGFRFGKPYVGANPMAQRSALMNACQDRVALSRGFIDLVRDLPGDETEMFGWRNCARQVRNELWVINNGRHSPALAASFSSAVYDFLDDHIIE